MIEILEYLQKLKKSTAQSKELKKLSNAQFSLLTMIDSKIDQALKDPVTFAKICFINRHIKKSNDEFYEISILCSFLKHFGKQDVSESELTSLLFKMGVKSVKKNIDGKLKRVYKVELINN
ncbi:hypothetical protein Phi12:1_gp28 [Cellulophaga phage phi12:1]|uniref:Uncharacterized protein n=2 Tax=Cellulophaga phage phi12:1 TaxID=1327976 RepID=R9ZXK7_9CAUD|nr:hypothetical protein Phi12:1_gp28 [Cellulophaga phage phi12:1]AGO47994.1 hypothetical protein Phi12:1_gp28 [Cellulophaga phage phi12:1]AGO48159.1 hypothetical protein Phi12:3_gp28 [Cellulophaga phage phi12:3]